MSRALICIAFLAFGIPALCNAQQPQLVSLDQSIDLHLHKATLMLVVGMLSVEKNVPIGIEFSANERNEPKLDIDVKNASLVEVLNLIVKQEPAYKWEFRDSVINFTPVHDRDPFFESLLNTPIQTFVSPKGNNRFAIREALLNLPEIKQIIAANGVEAGYLNNASLVEVIF